MASLSKAVKMPSSTPLCMAHDCQYAPDAFIKVAGFQSCPPMPVPPVPVLDHAYGKYKAERPAIASS
jgi:hypothetical protein